MANSEVEVWRNDPPRRLCGRERTSPLLLPEVEGTDKSDSGVRHVGIVASLSSSSSVSMPVDLERLLTLDWAMLSVSVSMLSSEWTLRRFVSTTAGRLWYIGTDASKSLKCEVAVDAELLLATRAIEFGITNASFSSSSSSVENLSARTLGCILTERLVREEYLDGLGGERDPVWLCVVAVAMRSWRRESSGKSTSASYPGPPCLEFPGELVPLAPRVFSLPAVIL